MHTADTTLADADSRQASLADVLQPIPRREKIIDAGMDAPPTSVRPLKFEAGVWRSLGRLLRWLSVITYILGGICGTGSRDATS